MPKPFEAFDEREHGHRDGNGTGEGQRDLAKLISECQRVARLAPLFLDEALVQDIRDLDNSLQAIERDIVDSRFDTRRCRSVVARLKQSLQE